MFSSVRQTVNTAISSPYLKRAATMARYRRLMTEIIDVRRQGATRRVGVRTRGRPPPLAGQYAVISSRISKYAFGSMPPKQPRPGSPRLVAVPDFNKFHPLRCNMPAHHLVAGSRLNGSAAPVTWCPIGFRLCGMVNRLGMVPATLLRGLAGEPQQCRQPPPNSRKFWAVAALAAMR